MMKCPGKQSALALCLLILSLLLLILNFYPRHLVHLPVYIEPYDSYDPALAARLQSMEDLDREVSELAAAKGVMPSDTAYANLVAAIMRNRFYHGYSHYSLSDNWVAALAGRFVWQDLSAIVLPDDILKYTMAACSQQSIVLMTYFKFKGITCRKISLNGHFAVEAYFNGHWYFFDTDKDPYFPGGKRNSIALLKSGGHLPGMYQRSLDSVSTMRMFKNIMYGEPGVNPAPRAMFFHRVTKWCAKGSWLFPFFSGMYLLLLSRCRKKRQTVVQVSISAYA